MIGESVEHPRYGRGRVVAVFRNGAEWMVRFDSGLRFRRPRAEFDGHAPAAPAEVALPAAPAAPMSRTQWEARQLVEALRVGVAPPQHVRELTVGLAAERKSLVTGLNQAHKRGGAVRAVIGDYGFGKSHIVELTAQEALARNFLVATASLDLLELPPHRPFDIYSALARSLRYPDTDERGLGPLLERSSVSSRLAQQMRERAPVENDPLVVALETVERLGATRQSHLWHEWLMGSRKVRAMTKTLARGTKLPGLYSTGHNARQMAYLLSGLSVLARLANRSGLCVLIDEAESYSLLTPKQRDRAGDFFRALIAATLRGAQSHIDEAALPQNRWRDYPLSYGTGQALFFLFTVTQSDNRMPLDEWLDPDLVLTLDPHHTPQEIGQFLTQVQGYHAQAYGYEAGERQGQLRRAAAELLAQGVRNDRLSIRGVVRLAIELWDLLHLYPDYPIAGLLDELRTQVQ